VSKDFIGIDFVILCFAAMDGFHVYCVTKNERNVMFVAEIGQPVTAKNAFGAMLLKDMTIFKFMLSAILVGMVRLSLLTDAGIITLAVMCPKQIRL
jgi:hypothetical protein